MKLIDIIYTDIFITYHHKYLCQFYRNDKFSQILYQKWRFL